MRVGVHLCPRGRRVRPGWGHGVTGGAAAAATILEEVLAEDLDFPRARALYENALGAWENALGAGAPGDAAGQGRGAAIAGLPGAASAEAAALPTLIGAGGVRHQRYL